MFSRGGRGWRGPGRRLVAGIACVGLALVVAAGACGGDDDGNSDDTTTSTSADAEPRQTTTTTFTPEEQEVVDAYQAYVEMGARLLEAPDPDDPEIQKRTTGEAYGDLVDSLTTLQATRRRVEFGPKYSHTVLSVALDEDAAVVESCVIDDARVIETDSGEVFDEGVTTVEWSVTLARRDGIWLVSHVIEEGVADGIKDCG